MLLKCKQLRQYEPLWEQEVVSSNLAAPTFLYLQGKSPDRWPEKARMATKIGTNPPKALLVLIVPNSLRKAKVSAKPAR
jgi:hypothetical protein